MIKAPPSIVRILTETDNSELKNLIKQLQDNYYTDLKLSIEDVVERFSSRLKLPTEFLPELQKLSISECEGVLIKLLEVLVKAQGKMIGKKPNESLIDKITLEDIKKADWSINRRILAIHGPPDFPHLCDAEKAILMKLNETYIKTPGRYLTTTEIATKDFGYDIKTVQEYLRPHNTLQSKMLVEKREKKNGYIITQNGMFLLEKLV